MVLALVAGTVCYGSAADEKSQRSAQWVEAAVRQAQEAQRRQREARLRWEYERRRSAAHARMPNTLYASTPSTQAHTDLACSVLVDDDTRRLYRDSLKGQTSSRVLPAPDLFRSGSSSNRSSSNGVRVFSARGSGTANRSPWPSKSNTDDRAARHKIQASGWAAASIQPKSGTDTTHHVYLVPSASKPLRQGFVRVINHSTEAGEVSIDPVDDGGRAFDTIALSIDANETVHFNSNDLETGNEGKGLTGSTGAGQGAWRLAFTSALDIEVLAYIRTTDGFLTAMHDVVSTDGDIRRVAIFNPGSNKNQVSRLRLISPTDTTANIAIRGTDDKGMPGSGEVSLSLDAGTAREITAEQLEEGGTGLTGMLGDGFGKWRLEVESEQAVVALSLLESPTDHLTNLSTVPEEPENGVHSVPLFPAAGDESWRQGFVRVINNAAAQGEVSIKAHDETERDYEPLTLTIGANAVVHFNSDDLEQGSPQKGLSGGTGAGEGDWRLELTSDLEIEVLSYIRTTDGFLTAMHDVAPSAETRYRVAVFNPGSNRNQESLLRLINPGDEMLEVTITGIDDQGTAGTDAVSLSIPAGGTRTLGAWDLESGAEGLDGALGDGAGKWQLLIESDRPVVAMSLLRSPTGHLTNLSTAPIRGARGGAPHESQTAEAVFQQLISGPIVQSKCIACHVEGGASGNTRLVFVPESDPDHEATNLQAIRDFLDEEDDGANYILSKIQGALGHGGGIQVAAGTTEYSNMERFLSLLGEDVGPVSITPATLFDGVEMESARSTLRRAAIIFAGRIPTDEEYESIETGGLANLRTAIRGLLEGPAFHAFLIRTGNDRLLTNRDPHPIDAGAEDNFVVLSNLHYEKAMSLSEEEHYRWHESAQYGFRRAPLELIAHVVENDLPYTEILTADYIMANPEAAEAFGAATEFVDPDNVHEFRPSKIASYYRDDDSKVSEHTLAFGTHVSDPGDLATDYPHAGILNTTVFLKRFPTTPTNRNRARSRWTYYHFLGLDIEKSASRTTDPVALADTNNPTMNNPACTVCHTVLDPVAGAFQNYGDDGLYRDQRGGLDALDHFYKRDYVAGQGEFEVTAASHQMRETLAVEATLPPGASVVRLTPHFDPPKSEGSEAWWNGGFGEVRVLDRSGVVVQRVDLADLHGVPRPGTDGEWLCGKVREQSGLRFFESHFCPQHFPIELDVAGSYTLEVEVWVYADQDVGQRSRRLSVEVGTHQPGDTWYRDMRAPGFGGAVVPDADESLPWLARRIVEDERFAEAAVKFWWPAIMGSEVAQAPEDRGDRGFEGQLLASQAQAHEVAQLARGFRQGFHGGSAYNLRDLLVEIVTSRWFRASRVADEDPVRAVALADAGARRLLTPEELAHKTDAVTGFKWKRHPNFYARPGRELEDGLTYDYLLLYGGIDSGGVTERARDMTSVMASVAKTMAVESSCPIVLREFYLLADKDKKLFGGIDRTVTPTSEFFADFEIQAESRAEAEALSLSGQLSAGDISVSVSFVNDHFDEETRADRNVRLDRLILRDDRGENVGSYEFEQLQDRGCGGPAGDHYNLACAETLEVPLSIPADGRYDVEIVAWADQAGDELPQVEISVDSDAENSSGARSIRSKLIDLHARLFGIELGERSPEIDDAYQLFIDVWTRKREFAKSESARYFEPLACNFSLDLLFFQGILDDIIVTKENDRGNTYYDWDRDRVNDFIFRQTDPQDPRGTARTWVVVLAHLLMDYRYLYL